MSEPSPVPGLILASASRSRAALLRGAGLDFAVQVAAIDESEIKAAMRAEAAPASSVAEALAELKAARVSRRFPEALVIGADQMLECGGRWYDKPQDRAEASDHLKTLRANTHELVTSACVLRAGVPLWHITDRARLTMWDFPDDFIARYLEGIGEQALESVGAYQLEGRGAQLFSRVEGDYFTILGLPLLPLLAFLREHGAADI